MERVGFAVGYDPAMNGREMAHWMGEAEKRGYEIGFFSETIELMRDSSARSRRSGWPPSGW